MSGENEQDIKMNTGNNTLITLPPNILLPTNPHYYPLTTHYLHPGMIS